MILYTLMTKEKWTAEMVEKEARKYTVKEHFLRKCPGGYKYAVRHGLISKFTWFEAVNRPVGYWTKERCEIESRKYTNKTDFKKKSSGAYEASRKNNWLNDYHWLKNRNITVDKVDCIYGYFFDNNVVYIGRTLNPKNRDIDHRKEKKRDQVYRYSVEHNVDIPPMTIIENDITLDEGIKREQFWIDYYRENNFVVLNKNKGGGIGSLTFSKYTREKIEEETRKYKSRDEFKKKSPNFYYHALKTGILQEIIPSNQVYKWGFWQDRKNVEEKSKEFETLSDFSKHSKGAYDAAVKGGYLKELTWLKRQRKRY